MPILWRYLLQSYLRVFSLSVSTFIAILFVSRFKEVARFAALSSDFGKTALFILYQFPLILPIAIPISALISSLFLFRGLSRTSQLTALYSSGLSKLKIINPILMLSFSLSLISFIITAELTPFCKRESKTLLYRNTSSNPLLLLQRQQLIKLKNAYLNLKVKEEGKSAKNFTLIAHNERNGRLCLILAEKLWIEEDELLGKNMAILSHMGVEGDVFDSLIIENQSHMSTKAPLLSKAVKKNRPKLNPSGLQLRHLKIEGEKRGKRGIASINEIFRRASLSASVFTFTFLGLAFGIETGRRPKKGPILTAVGLALLLLSSYLLTKGLKLPPHISPFFFIAPHLMIWSISWQRFNRIARGDL